MSAYLKVKLPWFDTRQTPGTHESLSLALPCHSWTEGEKNNKVCMSWEKDQEKILQGQKKAQLKGSMWIY